MKAINKTTQEEYEITGSINVMHDEELCVHYSVVNGEKVFTIELNNEYTDYIIE